MHQFTATVCIVQCMWNVNLYASQRSVVVNIQKGTTSFLRKKMMSGYQLYFTFVAPKVNKPPVAVINPPVLTVIEGTAGILDGASK